MRNRIESDRQAGFTLLEVAIAGSVALMVILGLFSAVKLASEQSSHIDKKRDERHMLSDLKYVLANPILCKGTMDLKREFKKGEEIQIALPGNRPLKKGEVFEEYGMKVDSLTVAGAVQYSEVRSYERQPGCTGASVEKFEYQRGKLVRTYPKEGEELCNGPLSESTSSFYVDLDIQLAALRKGGVKFRPERLARLTVVKRFEKDEGHKELCQAVNVVRVDSNVVTPTEFGLRSASLPDPNKDPAGFMQAASPAKPWDSPAWGTGSPSRGGGYARGPSGNGGGSLSAPYNPYEHSGRRGPPPPSFQPYAKASPADLPSLDDAAEEAARHEDAEMAYHRHMASLKPANQAAPYSSPHSSGPSASPAPAGGDVSRPQTEHACALNMSVDEAVQKGLPIVQHGGTLRMPVSACEAKKYLCWEGKLSDLGLPAEKIACGSDPNGLSGAELARQAAVPQQKAPELQECAVNRTLAEAKRLRLPIYRTGDRVSLPAGDCLEKSYVCYDGTLRDEGQPPVPVSGCQARELAAVK